MISIGTVFVQLGTKGVGSLTHNVPFGLSLEKLCPLSKPFGYMLKNDRFYLEPYFSAWDQRGLHQGVNFPIWVQVGNPIAGKSHIISADEVAW